jgi:hypothetical protein
MAFPLLISLDQECNHHRDTYCPLRIRVREYGRSMFRNCRLPRKVTRLVVSRFRRARRFGTLPTLNYSPARKWRLLWLTTRSLCHHESLCQRLLDLRDDHLHHPCQYRVDDLHSRPLCGQQLRILLDLYQVRGKCPKKQCRPTAATTDPRRSSNRWRTTWWQHLVTSDV